MRHAPDFAEVRAFSPSMFAAITQAIAAHMRAIAAGEASPGLLLTGAPGCGKTMIARRIVGILPALADGERRWLEIEYGASLGESIPFGPYDRPFRAPHHTISEIALVGERRSQAAPSACSCKGKGPAHQYHNLPRGPVGRASELTLARFGVLFLDELIEFRGSAVKAIGFALARLPAHMRPLLIAATDPCACGWSGTSMRECTCSRTSLDAYDKRNINYTEALGITVRIDVPSLGVADLRAGNPGPTSESLRARVAALAGVAS